ncbi:MAG: ribosome maturation factor RimP, partial [Rhodothermales bacterium]|nr:ribosome maturation factor RimP [Rhodothermales bacterium]
IVDIVVRGRQGSRVVEVFLDSDDGIGLDQLASFSREVGFLLEAEDVIKGKYRLNVSSPGADRPLTLPRQMRKHVGRKLSVKREEGKPVQGVLQSADDEGITLKKGKEEVRLAFDSIQEARVVLPW